MDKLPTKPLSAHAASLCRAATNTDIHLQGEVALISSRRFGVDVDLCLAAPKVFVLQLESFQQPRPLGNKPFTGTEVLHMSN